MYEPVTVITPKYWERRSSDIPVEEGPVIPPQKPPRRHKVRRQDSHEVPADGLENMRILRDLNNGDATCIDIDQINMQAANNTFKRINNNIDRPVVEVAVQTSHLIPYRLRFWPKSSLQMCNVNPDDAESCTLLRIKCCCTILGQWIFSQFGLTLVVVSWALLGALAFYRTEGPRELQQAKHLKKLQKDLSIELTTILVQTYKYPSNWAKTVRDYMQKHEDSVLEAVSEGFGEGGGGSIWSYPGCILFAVSLLTTLGFGAPVPRTALGRGAAVLFSAVGIPLHFLLILNMGHLGAIKLQRLAASGNISEIPTTPRPKWLKCFPVAAILLYYLLGVIFFGLIRQRGAVDSLMFPLDFTAAGGVGRTYGHVRILYALYLEFAVTLAALVVSLIQASATRGVVDVGLKFGLLTNT